MAVIENTLQKSNIIVSAKIIALTNKMITFLTQDGQHLLVPVTQSEREDILFLPTLKDIWHTELWIPVNRKLHQLLQYDWMAVPANTKA